MPTQTESSARTPISAKVANWPSEVRTAWYRLVPGSVGLKKESFSYPQHSTLSPQPAANVTKCHQRSVNVTQIKNFRAIRLTHLHTHVLTQQISSKPSQLAPEICTYVELSAVKPSYAPLSRYRLFPSSSLYRASCINNSRHPNALTLPNKISPLAHISRAQNSF